MTGKRTRSMAQLDEIPSPTTDEGPPAFTNATTPLMPSLFTVATTKEQDQPASKRRASASSPRKKSRVDTIKADEGISVNHGSMALTKTGEEEVQKLRAIVAQQAGELVALRSAHAGLSHSVASQISDASEQGQLARLVDKVAKRAHERGMHAIGTEDFAIAKAYLWTALELQPRNIDYILTTVDYCKRIKAPQAALHYAISAIQLEGIHPTVRTVMKLVSCHLGVGQYHEADHAIKTACQIIGGGDEQLRAFAGEVHAVVETIDSMQAAREHSNYHEVAAKLDVLFRKTQIQPSSWYFYRAEATIRSTPCDLKAAQAALSALPVNTETVFLHAEFKLAQGMSAAALVLYQEVSITGHTPSHRRILAIGHEIRGDQALAAGDHLVAMDEFCHALALDHFAPNAYFVAVKRGHARYVLERTDECIADCDFALLLRPGYHRGLHLRGLALVAQNRLEEAVTMLEQAVQMGQEQINEAAERDHWVMTVGLHAERTRQALKAALDSLLVLSTKPPTPEPTAAPDTDKTPSIVIPSALIPTTSPVILPAIGAISLPGQGKSTDILVNDTQYELPAAMEPPSLFSEASVA